MRLRPWIPAVVATVNGLAVAATVVQNQPNYPGRLLAAQIAIVLTALLLASKNRLVLAVGLFLVIASIVLTFSGMILYLPTLAAALWALSTRS